MRSITVEWRDPAWEARTDLQTLESNSPLGGRRYLLHDERTFENQWGVVMRVGSTGRLSGSDEPDASLVTTPPIHQLAYSTNLAAEVAALKAEGEYTSIIVTLPFKSAWYLRGLKNMLTDYYLHPDFVTEIYDRLVERELPRLRVAMEAGVDLIKIFGDVAMQDRMIMGPELWRELDKQAMQKLLTECRKINPDVSFFVHSDGDISPIMDDLVDDLGFDMVNPLQPECMDPVDPKVGVSYGGVGSDSVVVRRKAWNRFEQTPEAAARHTCVSCSEPGQKPPSKRMSVVLPWRPTGPNVPAKDCSPLGASSR